MALDPVPLPFSDGGFPQAGLLGNTFTIAPLAIKVEANIALAVIMVKFGFII